MKSKKQVDAVSVPRFVLGVEALAVLIVITIGYRLIWSQMLVDDAFGYIDNLSADRYSWDVAHLWLEPIALWIQRAVGDSADPVPTLTWINTLSVSFSLAIFYCTLRSRPLSHLKSSVTVLLAALSFNFVSLGPTAHIKMMVLPWLALSLHFAFRWERDICYGGTSTGRGRDLAISGAALGFGACFLVTMVPLIIGGLLFIIWRLLLSNERLRGAFWSAMPFAIAGGLAGLIGLTAAFLTRHATGTVHIGFVDFVVNGTRTKFEVAPSSSSFLSMIARTGYSTVYNFVYLEHLGQYGRAYLDGFIPSIDPFVGRMARDVVWALPTLFVLANVLWFSVTSGLRHRTPNLVALGFCIGGLLYAFLYNSNDPEHWIQLTMPTLLCLAVAVPPRVFTIAAAGWLPTMLVPNIAVYAYPRAVYALEKNVEELHSRLGSHGLLMCYAGYPGNMTVVLLPGIAPDRVIRPDVILVNLNYDAQATIAAIDKQLQPAVSAGYPVIVYRIMDENDWRGPAAFMAAKGLSPVELRQHLRRNYAVTPLGDLAGFPAWSLHRRTDP